LSIEFERDIRLVAAEPFGVVAWPLCEVLESTEALSVGAEAGDFGLEFAPGICRGRAAEGVLVGGEFLVVLSVCHVSFGSWSPASQHTTRCASHGEAIEREWRLRNMPLEAPWVIQLTSTP
jgi:hypothetical protein